MKWKYFLIIPVFSFNLASFALEQQEEKVAGKRPSSTELEEPSTKKISFAKPTSDTVFKHVLQDDKALKSLIKAFLGITDIQEIQRLDEFLNPIKPYGNLRSVVNSDSMKGVMKYPTAYALCIRTKNGLEECSDGKENLLIELSRVYKEMKDSFPPIEKDARVDVICKLKNDQYFMLEVQVIKQMDWDKRALNYAAHAYGTQLKRGDDWDKVLPVVAINILGREGIQWWPEDAPPFRSYTLIDEYDYKNTIPYIKILQCSLNNLDLKEKKNIREELKKREGLLDWLEYFKCAHFKDRIPEGIDEGLKVAYEQTIIDNFTPKMRNRYKKEEKFIAKYERELAENMAAHIAANVSAKREELINEGMQKGKEEGIREGEQKLKAQTKKTAKKMLDKGNKLEDVAEMLDVSIEELKELIVE